MAHTELDVRERRLIEDLLTAKASVSMIAARLDRHHSTTYREIKRNRLEDDELPELNGYYGVLAQKTASRRRHRQRKLVRCADILGAVPEGLDAGWSPERIAERMRRERQPRSISRETIYGYLYSLDGRSAELARYLPERRKRRQPRHARKPRGIVFPPDRAIQNRPEEVATRKMFGFWEGDLMIFQKDLGSTNVASLVERKTRYAVLFRNNDRSSRMLMNRLINLLSPLPVSAALDHLRPGLRVRLLAGIEERHGHRGLVLRPLGPLAERIGREPQQAGPAIAGRSASSGSESARKCC